VLGTLFAMVWITLYCCSPNVGQPLGMHIGYHIIGGKMVSGIGYSKGKFRSSYDEFYTFFQTAIKTEDAIDDKQNNEEVPPNTDMLSTLASAALNQDDKEEKNIVTVKEEAGVKKRTEQWHTVGVFDTNSCVVTDYLQNPETSDIVDLSTISFNGRKIVLEPGTAYKLRVCAVNACGAGPWSEVAAFKTTLPGFPGKL